MKSSTLMCFTALTLFGALAMPVQLAAQGHKDKQKHHHYQLIDVGTFGGPTGYLCNDPTRRWRGLPGSEQPGNDS